MPSWNLSRKHAKLILKPLFIVHAVNGLLKSYIATVEQKQSISVKIVGMAHACEAYIKC